MITQSLCLPCVCKAKQINRQYKRLNTAPGESIAITLGAKTLLIPAASPDPTTRWIAKDPERQVKPKSAKTLKNTAASSPTIGRA